MLFINLTITVFAIYYLNLVSNPLNQSVEQQIKNVTASETMVQGLVQMELFKSREMLDE
jgi:hypothetical protein